MRATKNLPVLLLLLLLLLLVGIIIINNIIIIIISIIINIITINHKSSSSSSGKGEDIVQTLTMMADQRLYKLVKWCKSLPLFKNILIDDQVISYLDMRDHQHYCHHHHHLIIPTIPVTFQKRITNFRVSYFVKKWGKNAQK